MSAESFRSEKSIFDYINIHFFLIDFYKVRKNESSSFSYEKWARQLGFKNKTILRLILQKKRNITLKSKSAFVEFFKFNQSEEEYFDALINYSQTKTASEKNLYGSLLIKLQRQNNIQNLTELKPEVIFDVYSPIILTIVNSSKAPLTVKDITKYCDLDEIKIENILTQLIGYNLISKNEKLYFSTLEAFSIKDHYGHPNLKKFYTFWLEKAQEAMNLPYDSRRFRSLQIALNQNEFEQIIDKSNEFATAVLSMSQQNSIEDRRLYLMNTMLFPVSTNNLLISKIES